MILVSFAARWLLVVLVDAVILVWAAVFRRFVRFGFGAGLLGFRGLLRIRARDEVRSHELTSVLRHNGEKALELISGGVAVDKERGFLDRARCLDVAELPALHRGGDEDEGVLRSEPLRPMRGHGVRQLYVVVVKEGDCDPPAAIQVDCELPGPQRKQVDANSDHRALVAPVDPEDWVVFLKNYPVAPVKLLPTCLGVDHAERALLLPLGLGQMVELVHLLVRAG